jgi:hypothetical protein
VQGRNDSNGKVKLAERQKPVIDLAGGPLKENHKTDEMAKRYSGIAEPIRAILHRGTL